MRAQRGFLILSVAAVLALGTAAAGGDPSPQRSAVSGDLEARILPGEGRRNDLLVGTVGTPLEVRYELKNLGEEPLLLPLAHPSFVKGTVCYSDPRSGHAIGGRAWGPAPLRSALIELAPGATRAGTLRLTPSSHGYGTVRLSFVCGHSQVSERVQVREEREGGGTAVHAERRTVDEPRLWHGHLVVRAPIEVLFSSNYTRTQGIDPRAVLALWKDGTPLLERIDTLGRVATLDPSSRAVDLLRRGFGRRYDGPASPLLVRIECAKQLAIAARRGYGWRGLKTLLRVLKDADEDESVRLLALEGLSVALDERLVTAYGDCTFDLRLPPGWRTEATHLFTTLAEQPSHLGRRAMAILKARAGRER